MTVTVVPTVEADNVPPRVRLDVSGTSEIATTVMRLNPDGTRTPVRTPDGNALPLPGVVTVVDFGDATASSDVVTFNSDGTASAAIADNGDGTAPEAVTGGGGLLYDYEAPFGALVSYTTLESPDTVSAEVVVPADQVWLIHPGVPALSMPVSLRPGTLQDAAFAARQGVFYVMGRANPVVVTDGARKGAASQLVVTTQSLDELSSLLALLSDAGALFFNPPADMNVGFGPAYIAVGDVKLSRWTDVQIDANRDVTLPFTVVDRPAGGTQSERTWADVIAECATWGDVMAKFPTWLDVLAGP
jgi:hypothetical protein